MHFILNADYSMGVGDFLVKLYALCHVKKYIKENYPKAICSLFLEEYKSNILHKILNTDFFVSYFDSFEILNNHNQEITGLGSNSVSYNGSIFRRVYSAINECNNNKPGYWDIYLNIDSQTPNIPFIDFDYRDPTTRHSQPIPDYNLPLFQEYLFDNAKKFIREKLNSKFSSIYYRVLFQLDNNHLHSSVDCILSKIQPDTKYFLTSNSDNAKTYILSQIPNTVVYSNPENKPDGCGTADTDQLVIERLFTEMFIMAYGSSILYAGNHHYISLYNYYAHMIKQVPLIHC